MFCDLVDSTPLSENLDPEELREIIRAYQDTCSTVISRFGGEIAQYLGDGVLVYFGYPVAYEDSAQRAVHAGLAIVEAIQMLSFPALPLPHPLQVRVGIHTGLVVVGEMGRGGKREHVALGEALNLAARLQELATPNSVVISAATARLIQGFFACQDLGFHTLKGLSTPVHMYHVLDESGARSRLDVAVSAGLTPLVGREHEVGLFMERWQSAKGGAGQVVLLSGEAGIGKSRLLQALKEHLAEEAPTLVELRCSPHHQHSALYPAIDYLQRLLHFHGEDSPQVKSRRLAKALEEPGLAAELPLFANLLSLPDAPPHALSVTPQRQKQKTLQALLDWFLIEAKKRSALMIVEDLHWVDPSTLEFLNLLFDHAPTARILVVLTFRPEFTPPWAAHSFLTQISLGRLGRTQVEAMVEQVVGDRVLPAEVLQQVVAKTDGVPLFVEELTKMVLESGWLREREGQYELTAALPPLAIPVTLHDSLMARLDRLSTVKDIAQLGATLGREFTYEVLRAVSSQDEEMLQRDLARLVEADLLHQRGFPPQARYVFKHALIQEAAYQSLLKSTRQQSHRQIAQTLAEQFHEIADTQPELLAHHYTEAGLVEQAIPYWQQAGQRAIARSAHLEAISHLTKGLETLKTLSQTPERSQQELTLQLALGVPLTATKGYAADEVGKVYTRARELSRQMGESFHLFPVLFGLWRFYLQRAELQTARELAEQCLSLAERVHDPAPLLRAHNTLGVTLFYLGEFVSARSHLEQAIALYDPQQRRSLARVQDPVVACLAYAAWTLWHLGYPDQALQRSQEALAMAQELSHPYSSAMIFFFAAELHYLRREVEAVQERTAAAIALSAEQAFPFWLSQGTSLQGWAVAERGQREEGIAQMRQGFSLYQATGSALGRSYWLMLPTATQGQVGQAAEGLQTLDEAHAAVLQSGERYYEAEIYRLKGTLTLQKFRVSSFEFRVSSSLQSLPPSPHAEAEAEGYFLKATEIARHQQAKSLELRAATSLARLWQQQGKHHAALNILSAIYNWFTEGFTTADLQEAGALLEELSH
jgi:class 3 adenylate cyclase/predicted ATPase